MENSEQYGEDRDNKGRFTKGNNAASGRGGNKVSTKVKESIVKFLEDNVDAIQESFDTLKPKEKLEFIRDILSYAAPKLSSTQVEADHSGSISIKFEEPGDYVYPSEDQSDSGISEGV